MSPDAPDYTLLSDVNIKNSEVTIDVNLVASAITLNVNVTNTSLDVNATIVSSTITLDVNVTNSSLTVNIGAPLTTDGNVATAIQESIQIDVNIAASSVTLDVNIASSGVTLDVNIASSSVTLDVSITNATVTLNVNVTNEVLQGKLAKPALALNGENAYVGVSDSASLNPSNITVIVWVKPDYGNSTQYGRLVDKHEAYRLFMTSATGIRMDIWTAGGSDKVEAYDQPLDGELHAWAMRYDGTTMSILRDGTEVASKTHTYGGDISTSTYDLGIGASLQTAGGTWFAAGFFYQVLIYNRALSDDEIQEIVNNPQTPITKGLILWLNFDEGSGDTAYDKSGNGNHGTIHNCVWVSEQGQVAPLLNVNLTASQITLNINITAQDVDITVLAPTGKAVTMQTIVSRNDYFSWSVAAGGSASQTIATGKGRFKRLVGQIFTTSTTAYVDWRNIRIAIYADGEDKFSAGGLTICSIDEATGAITINSVEGATAGETWIGYYPGRAFRIIRVEHDDITATYDPTSTTVNTFSLPFRELSFEIEMDIEFESSLEIEITNGTGFSPTSDIIMLGWVEWGEYL